MFRISLIIIILLSASSLNVGAVSKKSVNHGRNFSLNRAIVVDCDNEAAKDKITELITKAGASVKTKGLLASKIVVDRVRNIDGVTEKNAFQIKVTPKKVIIHYTSDVSLSDAMLKLTEMVTYGKIIGKDITDWHTSPLGNEGVIDCSARILTATEIEGKIKAERAKQVVLILADSDNWRIETDVFKLVNPQQNIYPDGRYYTQETIAAIIAKAARNKLTVVPMVELLTPNASFERVTGHSQFSVEGMRFVRAIIEELVQHLGCKKICLGTKSDAADERYMQFIEDIAAKCDVELLIN